MGLVLLKEGHHLLGLGLVPEKWRNLLKVRWVFRENMPDGGGTGIGIHGESSFL